MPCSDTNALAYTTDAAFTDAQQRVPSSLHPATTGSARLELATSVTGQQIMITGILDSGADVTVISQAKWPPTWTCTEDLVKSSSPLKMRKAYDWSKELSGTKTSTDDMVMPLRSSRGDHAVIASIPQDGGRHVFCTQDGSDHMAPDGKREATPPPWGMSLPPAQSPGSVAPSPVQPLGVCHCP
ncbi:hypothetical protein Nmel_015696 [Mimus melanotis]